MKMNNDQELKLKQLDNKVSNELKQFNDIINKEINDIKNSMKQIKYNNEIGINKLEEEMKKIKVDFNYLGQDLATKVKNSGLTYDEYYAFYLDKDVSDGSKKKEKK